jgi:hypothetical protein
MSVLGNMLFWLPIIPQVPDWVAPLGAVILLSGYATLLWGLKRA